MANLLELNEKLSELDELLENLEGTDIPPDCEAAFDELLTEREETNEAYLEKIDNYLALIQSRKYSVSVRKAELKRMQELVEKDEKTVELLQDRLKNHLESKDTKKLRTNRFNLSICNNGGKQPMKLRVENPEDLPEQFQKIKVEADSNAIRKALEAGDELVGAIAYLEERGQHLRIK